MPSPESLHNSDLQQRKVWVLAPHLHTGDANVDYYYDFSQSIQEYTKAFAELEYRMGLATGNHAQLQRCN